MESYIEFTFPDEEAAVPNMNIVNLDWGQMFLVAQALTTTHGFDAGDLDGPVSIKVEFKDAGSAVITKKLMTLVSRGQMVIAQKYMEFEAQRMLQFALLASEQHAEHQAQLASARKVILPD